MTRIDPQHRRTSIGLGARRLTAAARVVGLVALAAAASSVGATAAPRCEARSAVQPPLLVELYTSEGCDSCPPADRWLSTLRGRTDVLAAAFHVDYWDRLGWVDRFGNPRYSQRQAEQQPLSGARFSYTPQVLVNGRDWRRWPALPAAAAAASSLVIELRRDDAQTVMAEVRTPAVAGAAVPPRLAAWWAVLEDGHRSAVQAGENRGTTLQHDHVVRQYTRLPAFASTLPQHWRLPAAARGEGGRATRLLLVVTDAETGLPLQAVQLAC